MRGYREAVRALRPLSVERLAKLCRARSGLCVNTPLWRMLPCDISKIERGQVEILTAAYAEAVSVRVRAAFQSFDFSALQDCEIVLWGSADALQGVALAQLMRERGVAQLVRRVTIFEPNRYLAAYAAENMRAALPEAVVDAEAVWIPVEGRWPVVRSFTPEHHDVLHIVGSTLFADRVKLRRLAWLMTSGSATHHIALTSPLTDRSQRCAELASLFVDKFVWSDISETDYTYLSDGTPLSLRAVTFTCRSRTLNEDVVGLPPDFAAVSHGSHLDFPVGAHVRYSGLPDGVISLCNRIRKLYPEGLSIHLRPSIGTLSPDIVILREGFRPIVIKIVCKDGLYDTRSIHRCLHMLRRECVALSDIAMHECEVQGALLSLDLSRSDFMAALFNSVLTQQNLGGISIIGKDSCFENDVVRFVDGLFVPVCNRNINDTISGEIAPVWHSAMTGMDIKFTPWQLAVASGAGRSEYVSGPPGCGKTMSLAVRSVIASQHGGRVLVVVHNSADIAAFRICLRRVPADYAPGRIHVRTYAQLVAEQGSIPTAVKCGLPKNINKTELCVAAESAEVYLRVPDRGRYDSACRKYDTILVDNAHCFTPSELEEMRDALLHPGGEFTVAATRISDGTVFPEGCHVASDVPRYRNEELRGFVEGLCDAVYFYDKGCREFMLCKPRSCHDNCTNIRLLSWQSNPPADRVAGEILLLMRKFALEPGATAVVSDDMVLLRHTHHIIERTRRQYLKMSGSRDKTPTAGISDAMMRARRKLAPDYDAGKDHYIPGRMTRFPFPHMCVAATFMTNDELDQSRMHHSSLKEYARYRGAVKLRHIDYWLENMSHRFVTSPNYNALTPQKGLLFAHIDHFRSLDMPNVILLLSDNSQSVSKLLAGASRATDTLLVITMGEGLYKNLLTSYVKA